MTTDPERLPRRQIDKFTERRNELAQAALMTLAEIGYARASLREIAQNSQFTHGVLHYYFKDKFDLITCSVRQYKAECVTRYDTLIAAAKRFEDLESGFLKALATTMCDDAHMHRLWYDLRSQALYEEELRQDVAFIDQSLSDMIARVTARFRLLAGAPQIISDGEMYPMYDGLFEHYLLKHVSGQPKAASELKAAVRKLIRLSMGMSGAHRPVTKAIKHPSARRGRN
ncbi:MAG: TetR/AcrR family transcriptional regulator [Caulobacterales bacterium]